MENPVRPTAAINRFNARRQAGPSQGQIASMNASKILERAPAESSSGATDVTGMMNQLKRSGVGWKTRKELGQQFMANQQSGSNAALQADTSLATARMSEGTARERNDIDRFGTEANANIATEKNRIDKFAHEATAKNAADTLAAGGPVREAQASFYNAQAADLPVRRDIDQAKIGVDQQKIAADKEKAALESINKIDDPVAQNNTLITFYDPAAPRGQLQNMAKNAISSHADAIFQEYNEGSGMFDKDPIPDIITKYFPLGMPPLAAQGILESIPDRNLKGRLGSALKARYSNR